MFGQKYSSNGFYRQIYAAMSASMGGFSYTAVFGWVTPILPRLLSDKSEIPMTSDEASWMISLPQLITCLSPIPAAMLADRFGRKPVILASAPLFTAGWLITLILRTYPALIFARFLQGLGIGITLSVTPVYLGEIASTEYRGAITSMFFIFTWIGYLFEYCTGPFLTFTNFTLLTLATCVFFFLVFLVQPETPHFYLMNGDKTSALEALKWFRSSSEDSVKLELEAMELTIEEDRLKGSPWREVVATAIDRKALYILLFTGLLRGLCGVIPFVSYATSHFKLTSNLQIKAKFITIILGIVLMVTASLSFFIMDALGRRPLLVISCLLSSACSFTASVFYYYQSETNIDVDSLSVIPSILVLMFAASLVAGVYPVMSAYTSELFNSKTRSLASSINVTLTTIFTFAEFKLYQNFIDVFNVYFNFLLFSIICLVGAVISYLFMPETKNKTFQEIRTELAA